MSLKKLFFYHHLLLFYYPFTQRPAFSKTPPILESTRPLENLIPKSRKNSIQHLNFWLLYLLATKPNNVEVSDGRWPGIWKRNRYGPLENIPLEVRVTQECRFSPDFSSRIFTCGPEPMMHRSLFLPAALLRFRFAFERAIDACVWREVIERVLIMQSKYSYS